MKIQLRLSNEAQIILEEEKIKLLRTESLKTTKGEITDAIFKGLSSDIINNKIDWKYVKECPEFDGILGNYKNINPSALNLNDSTLDLIESLRNKLNSLFEMDRMVYRSFIIRIVLKAYKLKETGDKKYKKSAKMSIEQV